MCVASGAELVEVVQLPVALEGGTLPDGLSVDDTSAIVDRLCQCQTEAEFDALMDVIDIPWGLVRDPRKLESQATLRHRKRIVEIDDRDGGTRPIADSPYIFSNAKSGVRLPASHQGEHNREILSEWLGLSEAEVDELSQSGLLPVKD